jgi:hypothetical protein
MNLLHIILSPSLLRLEEKPKKVKPVDKGEIHEERTETTE